MFKAQGRTRKREPVCAHFLSAGHSEGCLFVSNVSHLEMERRLINRSCNSGEIRLSGSLYGSAPKRLVNVLLTNSWV